MSLNGLGGAGLDSPLGQAFQFIETLYWQAEIWFMVSMLLIGVVIIFLIITIGLGITLMRLQGVLRDKVKRGSGGSENLRMESLHQDLESQEEAAAEPVKSRWSQAAEGSPI